MSQVNVINVIAHNAKAPFLTPLSFEIFFEALQPLRHIKSLNHSLQLLIMLWHIFMQLYKPLYVNIALTWRIIYIG
jgi:hypothetical protein